MAISVDWDTRVIYVPKADMTLIQETPTEIRELNLNNFRLALKDLEDSEEGIVFPDTHRHNTEVTVAGLTLARVIEIINGYTVTFEDGQYAVNLPGANSNVGDVVNVNQVSVRTFNSAGLISSPAIEFASYQNCVTIDMTSPYSGTIYPKGTMMQPVNNLVDALLIAATRGLNTFFILGNADIDSFGDYSGIVFIGEGCHKTMLDVNTNANVFNAEFINAMVMGVLDGQATLKDCMIGDLTYVSGRVERCLLDEGVITLGGNQEALFLDCWCGSPDSIPIIDMGGSGQSLSLRNYSGAIKIRNKSGPEPVSITLLAGQVELDSTVTNGTLYICGNGVVIDNSGGTAVVITTDLLSPGTISQAVRTELAPELSGVMRVLGLVQENFRLGSQEYDGDGNLQSALLRIYASAADAQNDVNPIAEYAMAASFSGPGQCTSYLMTRTA